MGRLFWKFFVFIWLVQLLGMAGVGAIFWLKAQSPDEQAAGLALGPAAAFLAGSAAATLQHGGVPALRSLLEDAGDPGGRRRTVYAVDEAGRELLGRELPPEVLAQARRNAGRDSGAVRSAAGPDGHRYLMFVPAQAARGVPARRPHAPHRDRPLIPVLPLTGALLASLLCAALLAWYVSKPIRHLRGAFEAAAGGHLDVRVGARMGARRDELADLGRDFDRMAGQLQALMDSQRRLLHDVSHELRSPLARLQMAIGLARQQPDRLEASMQRIEQETVRIDGMVDELLTLSRLEAGVMAITDEEIRIGELLADIVADARFEAEASRQEVLLQGDCDAALRGRPELLHRALENVVRNALKHTPPGSRITISCRREGRALHIEVADEGPGVAESELHAIFRPFYRGSGPAGKDGHGLGLAIAQRVVVAHGGTISARNQPGGGLCVAIALPLDAGRGQPVAGAAAA